MKKIGIPLLFSLVFFPLVSALSEQVGTSILSDLNNRLIISQNARQRALEKRGEKIIGIRDALIKNTLQAYGGDYFRDGKLMSIILNGRIYRDFTLKIVRGQFLEISTPNGVIYLEVVEE